MSIDKWKLSIPGHKYNVFSEFGNSYKWCSTLSNLNVNELQFSTAPAQLRLASPHRSQRLGTPHPTQETLEQEEAMIEEEFKNILSQDLTGALGTL